MAYYPAGFLPSYLTLYFARYLEHAVVSSLQSNQFLGRVALSFFLCMALQNGTIKSYQEKVQPIKIQQTDCASFVPKRLMVPISSLFICSQLQEEQHMVFTLLTSVNLVCVYTHANKIRILSQYSRSENPQTS